jgi:hypothetical protein
MHSAQADTEPNAEPNAEPNVEPDGQPDAEPDALPNAQAGVAVPTSKNTRKQQEFKRAYKACESCRVSKARCEREEENLCARCRREGRECIFPAQRSSKRKRERARQDETEVRDMCPGLKLKRN